MNFHVNCTIHLLFESHILHILFYFFTAIYFIFIPLNIVHNFNFKFNFYLTTQKNHFTTIPNYSPFIFIYTFLTAKNDQIVKNNIVL